MDRDFLDLQVGTLNNSINTMDRDFLGLKVVTHNNSMYTMDRDFLDLHVDTHSINTMERDFLDLQVGSLSNYKKITQQLNKYNGQRLSRPAGRYTQ